LVTIWLTMKSSKRGWSSICATSRAGPAPKAGDGAGQVDDHVEHLLTHWGAPSRTLPKDAFYEPLYRTQRANHTPVEPLLEHAVVRACVRPIRAM
jgi:hypothetical protein